MKIKDVDILIQLATKVALNETEEEHTKPIGFRVLEKIHKDSGYEAVILQSLKTSYNIVICHQARDYYPMKHFLSDVGSKESLSAFMRMDVTDDAYILFKQNEQRIQDALKTTQEVSQQYIGFNIKQVGYSLGGFFAQMCYALSSTIMDTLILDAPGAAGVLHKYYPEVTEAEQTHVKCYLKIVKSTGYSALGNVGTEYHYYKEKGQLEYYFRPVNGVNTAGDGRILAASHPVKVLPTNEEISGTKVIDYFFHTVTSHNIVKFKQDFDRCASFEQVINWPNGFIAGFHYHLSANNTSFWEKIVKDQIYSDVCTRLQQEGSTYLLDGVTKFFKHKYLSTNKDEFDWEFNWKLYNATLEEIGEEYCAFVKQRYSFSILSRGSYLCEHKEDDLSYYTDTVKCATDEVQDNWSDFQSLLQTLPQTLSFAILMSGEVNGELVTVTD
jgi:hypothetical protein